MCFICDVYTIAHIIYINYNSIFSLSIILYNSALAKKVTGIFIHEFLESITYLEKS